MFTSELIARKTDTHLGLMNVKVLEHVYIYIAGKLVFVFSSSRT